MNGMARSIVAAGMSLSLAACGGTTGSGGESDGGGGDRKMTGSWEIRLDPDRTLKLDLDGSFTVYEDKTEAAAGETDIMVDTFGTLTVSNVSDGRAIDMTGWGDWDTGLELFVPIESCPDWADLDGPLGTHCSRDIVELDIPNLDVDASEEIDLEDTTQVASVKTDDAKTVIGAMLVDSVVVHADRVFWNEYLEKLNPTCESGDVKWVTYFSEDKTVTACSTESQGQN